MSWSTNLLLIWILVVFIDLLLENNNNIIHTIIVATISMNHC